MPCESFSEHRPCLSRSARGLLPGCPGTVSYAFLSTCRRDFLRSHFWTALANFTEPACILLDRERRNSNLPLLERVPSPMQARGNSSGRAARSRWLLLAAPALLLLAVTISQSDTDSARTLSKLPNAVQQQLVGAWGARDQRGIYGAPGWLAVDRTIKPIHRRARWVPLDRLQDLAQLGLTGLETDYQLDDGYDLLSQYRNALGPTNNTQALSEIPNLSFLRDKTILLIGDSQDRYLTDVACEDHLQGTLTYRDFWWRQDGEHSLSEVVAGKKYRTIALHHCQLPSSLGNTSIWSSTTYGSVTEEDTFGKMYPNFPEKALEARIRRLGQAFRNEGLRPDLIIAHTMSVRSAPSEKGPLMLMLAVLKAVGFERDESDGRKCQLACLFEYLRRAYAKVQAATARKPGAPARRIPYVRQNVPDATRSQSYTRLLVCITISLCVWIECELLTSLVCT